MSGGYHKSLSKEGRLYQTGIDNKRGVDWCQEQGITQTLQEQPGSEADSIDTMP